MSPITSPPTSATASSAPRTSLRTRRTAELQAAATVLRDRAATLCRSAQDVHPLLASAYRRRAGELALAAWVGSVASSDEAPVLSPCAA